MDDTTLTAPSAAVATVQALYAAFGSGDMAALLDLVAADVDWSVDVAAPGAERVSMFHHVRGRDAVLGYFRSVADLRFDVFDPAEYFERGDRVAVVIDVDVTHVGTGKRAVFQEVHRFRVRDGRIDEYRPSTDTAAVIDLFTP